jgi:PBSX family phage terminase large subunit
MQLMINRRPKQTVTFKFQPFSRRQMQVLSWWRYPATKDKYMVIADGSIRAGKTVVMSMSFVLWSMHTFDRKQFGMAGKTIGSLRRNVVGPLKQMLASRGFHLRDNRAENMITISRGGKENYYYLFGGKDESSQDLVQGLTTAGFFFDEVALMPESFVNQATARNSETGAKLWFNCNPAGPFHWFKTKWIDRIQERNALRLHFLMTDNPSMDLETRQRYESQYSGVFYKRYIQGLWVMAEGIIYSNFNADKMVVDLPADTVYEQDAVSIDYGTMNATAFKRWSLYRGVWYSTDEYYYSGRDSETNTQLSDEQYSDELEQFYQRNSLEKSGVPVILDPSAKSFKVALKQRGFRVRNAKNNVLDGIRSEMSLMDEGKIKWSSKCVNTFREMNSYIWDEKAADRGEDKPVKQHDHACDADRYMVETVIVPYFKRSYFWHGR